MAFIELNLTGVDELVTKLRDMPAKVEKSVLKDATKDAMTNALPDMVGAVPMESDEQSPDSKKYGTTRQNLRVIALTNLGRNNYGARIDTNNAFWQWYYNFGSRHQPARPWFAPRFRAMAQKVLDNFVAAVGAEIERLWQQ
jgi:HK97 gp10 family phage protein